MQLEFAKIGDQDIFKYNQIVRILCVIVSHIPLRLDISIPFRIAPHYKCRFLSEAYHAYSNVCNIILVDTIPFAHSSNCNLY